MTKKEEIKSIGELLAHARVLETEAYECYCDLAEQMDVHHNKEVAGLFRKLAEEEKRHIASVEERAGTVEIPHMAPWDFKAFDAEVHGLTGAREVHYMMTPYHALKLALRAEKRSFEYFSQVIESSNDEQVLEMARELQEDERRHIDMVKAMLEKEPKPDDDWDEDPDPPVQPH